MAELMNRALWNRALAAKLRQSAVGKSQEAPRDALLRYATVLETEARVIEARVSADDTVASPGQPGGA
jgi:hypothetical protein